MEQILDDTSKNQLEKPFLKENNIFRRELDEKIAHFPDTGNS